MQAIQIFRYEKYYYIWYWLLEMGFGELFWNVGTTNEIVVIVKCHGPAAKLLSYKVYACFSCVCACMHAHMHNSEKVGPPVCNSLVHVPASNSIVSCFKVS